jgi:hypothetical protein
MARDRAVGDTPAAAIVLIRQDSPEFGEFDADDRVSAEHGGNETATTPHAIRSGNGWAAESMEVALAQAGLHGL